MFYSISLLILFQRSSNLELFIKSAILLLLLVLVSEWNFRDSFGNTSSQWHAHVEHLKF